jgi:hypothetical protein
VKTLLNPVSPSLTDRLRWACRSFKRGKYYKREAFQETVPASIVEVMVFVDEMEEEGEEQEVMSLLSGLVLEADDVSEAAEEVFQSYIRINRGQDNCF